MANQDNRNQGQDTGSRQQQPAQQAQDKSAKTQKDQDLRGGRDKPQPEANRNGRH